MADSGQAVGGWVPSVSKPSWWQRLWAPFWALPLAMAVVSILLGAVLPLLDEALSNWVPVIFHGGPDSARSVLGTVASAMISVTGLVFSVTMVVLQLASSQFTPRVLGSFLDNRITQVTFGVFIGTFIYSLTVLRSVRSANDAEAAFVPQLATGIAFLSVIASVGCFLAFIHHITTSIQVQEVIARTGAATTQTLDRMIPADQSETASRGEEPRWEPGLGDVPTDVILEHKADRVITDFDYRRLLALAEDKDVVITLERQVGDYIVAGTTAARVWRTGQQVDSDSDLIAPIRSLITLDRDRSLRQDVGFGIRQLVDIAERALSPGVNDPTTARQAINALESVLYRAVQRPVPSGHVTDEAGVVRLVYKPQSVEQLLTLAVTEIAHWGGDSVRVPTQLREMLESLDDVALPQYRETIAELLELVSQKQAG